MALTTSGPHKYGLSSKTMALITSGSLTGKPTYFLNEIEITPTLYLSPKFGHGTDFIP